MGMHGWKHVNRAIQSADLLIALGMRFDDRVTGKVSTYAPNARIIHVDIDPSEIGKNVAVDVPIVGDVGRVLRALIAAVRASVDPAERADYFAQLAAWRADSEGRQLARLGCLAGRPALGRLRHQPPRRADRPRRQRSSPTSASTRCGSRATPASVGPTRHLSSGGLGTMGYGLPAAMGAALGRPDKETWAVVGDGGLQMTARSCMTVVADRDPGQGRAHGQREAGHDPPVAGDHLRRQLPLGAPAGPDWAKLAEAYGLACFRARTPEEVDDAIRAAQAMDGPALVWFRSPRPRTSSR